MATNNFSEYTSLLQGYQKKRKSKKKKVIAAAALTFFKNLADKALTRNTANELAGYKSEYTKLATDASSEYKKQENFVNIGTTRGGGDYTYATTDEGEDTINFQYPDIHLLNFEPTCMSCSNCGNCLSKVNKFVPALKEYFSSK